MPHRSLALFLSLTLSSFVGGFPHAQATRMPAASPLPAQETDGLVERIRREEYRFEPVKKEQGTWSAPNRAQGLRSRVSERGLEVFPRATGADGAGAPWKLSLATASFGRTDDAFELPRASVSVTDERVELDHGYLVEWFVNDERGIEQGWTIPERLVGSEALSIGLAIEGELSLRIEERARSGVLVDPCGEAVLRYRDLRAFDATGRELDARIVPTPTGVAIEVDDAGAAYPLTVDPLLTDPAWSADSDQAGAYLGIAVSTAGDVNGDGYSDVIIGAHRYDGGQADEGRAYVYHGSASGLATSPNWTAESDQAGAEFGTSVAMAGDVNGDGFFDVIVGASKYDGGQVDEGRAYVYHGSAVGLATSPAWTAESDETGADFGESVATAGDVNGDGYSDVVVGARYYDYPNLPGTDAGSAYAFLGSSSGLTTAAVWNPVSDELNASFGESVATAGDVNGDGYSDVIVGAPYYRPFDGFFLLYGAAFVYYGSVSGLSASPARTLMGLSFGFDSFGHSVTSADLNADGYSDVIVAAYFFGSGGGFFIYYGSAAGLAEYPFGYETPEIGIMLGYSIAAAGDVNGDGYADLIVGAPKYSGGQAYEGRVYVYKGFSEGLSPVPAWSVESNQAGASFGYAVAGAGDVNGDGYSDLIVGAPDYDDGLTEEGRAFVYHGAADGLAESPVWGAESNHADALFGSSVASAGDVNGDGYSDVIVGAFHYDTGQPDGGRAFVYLGSASGLAVGPSWTAQSDHVSAFFGLSVSTAGDVNGDGYSDVIVGAPGYNERKVFVYHGSPAGLLASPSWSVYGGEVFQFGYSVSTAGDVNGDGYSDVIVGAYAYDGDEGEEGRAYVYHGSSSGLASSAAWTAESHQSTAHFGLSVSTAGDVNGDGYSDVIVGADRYDGGQPDEGQAYVFHGSASGLASSAAWTAESNQANARFGASVATAGDVNGDGYSDVVVGAYGYDGVDTDTGRAYVYHGSASGLAATPAWTAQSNQTGAYFGFSVSTAGDVNADGYSDVVVGAVLYDSGESDEGRAFAYLGSASGLAASEAWTAESNQETALFGNAVSTAGDVNGDGYSDVIVGAPYFDAGEGSEGRVWVYLGNEGRRGLMQGLQQRTSDGASPLSLQGSAGVSGAFQIHAEFPTSSAPNASTAQLEWEVKPMGVPFDGQGIESGTPQPLGPGGGPMVFDELVTPADVGRSFLTRASTYRWRARVATDDPLRPHTPWFSVPGNALTEAKLRKAELRFR